MKFHQLRVLTDENVSPKIVAFLRNHGLDVLDTKEQGWQGKSDDELLEFAYQDNRWVLTHDADFGTLPASRAPIITGAIAPLPLGEAGVRGSMKM